MKSKTKPNPELGRGGGVGVCCELRAWLKFTRTKLKSWIHEDRLLNYQPHKVSVRYSLTSTAAKHHANNLLVYCHNARKIESSEMHRFETEYLFARIFLVLHDIYQW